MGLPIQCDVDGMSLNNSHIQVIITIKSRYIQLYSIAIHYLTAGELLTSIICWACTTDGRGSRTRDSPAGVPLPPGRTHPVFHRPLYNTAATGPARYLRATILHHTQCAASSSVAYSTLTVITDNQGLKLTDDKSSPPALTPAGRPNTHVALPTHLARLNSSFPLIAPRCSQYGPAVPPTG